MNATLLFGPLEMLFIVLFGGGFGMPAAVPPTEQDVIAAHVAPAECLVYTSWAGTAEPDASSGNHTEQLLAEPEVQKFLNGGMDQLMQMVGMRGANDPQAKQGIDDVFELVELIQRKPGAIFLSNVELHGHDTPTIHGGGLIRVDDDAEAVKELMLRLQQQMKTITRSSEAKSVEVDGHTLWSLYLDDDVPVFSWGIVGQHLVFGIGDGSVEKLIARMDDPAPKWLDEIHAKLPVPRVSTVSYVDIGRCIELIEAICEMNHTPEFADFVSKGGLDKITTLTAVSGMDATGCVNRMLLTVDGPGTGLLQWIDSKPLGAGDLELIGRGSPVTMALKLDLMEMYDLWLEILEVTEPRDAERFQRDVEQFKQQVGVEVRGDLLQSIGDTWRLFAQPGSDDLLAGWTLAVDVRDHKKLLATQEKLVTALRKSLEDLRQAFGGVPAGAPTLEAEEIDGITIHTMDLRQVGLPVSPSWCVTEKDLIVTLNPEALKKLLGNPKDQPSLAQVPQIKPEIADDSRTLGLLYLDTKPVAEALLPIARQGLQMFAQQGGLPFPVDTTNLPSAEVVIGHLQPTVLVCRRTDDGVEFESRHTLPGPNIAATAPLGLAVSLPAVIPARAAARRAQSLNNVKQIALGMYNFHQDHGAFLAGYSADKDGKPLLSWRVHVLPYIAGKDLYEQFHLDEPWDSEHNKKLIEKMPPVFRSPASAAKPGMTNYLGVGGADGVFVRPKPGGRMGSNIAQITDGSSQTIMVVEVPDKAAVIWTRPADFAPTENNLKEGLFGMHPSGVIAGFADGSCRILGNLIDRKILKAFFTKSGDDAAAVISPYGVR